MAGEINVLDDILDRGLIVALALAEETRSRIENAVAEHSVERDRIGILRAARYILEKINPLMAQTLSDATMMAWLFGQSSLAVQTPGLTPSFSQESPFKPSLPEVNPIFTYPIRDEAIRDLTNRKLMFATDYYEAEAEIRAKSFTVSRIQSEKTLQKIQDALAKDVAEGGMLRDFKKFMAEATDVSALAPGQVETVYRTNVGQAYGTGQRRVLDNPYVKLAFPYVVWNATRDARVRKAHWAMETAGLDGTTIYRSDDPEIIRVWAPHAWNCRCVMVAITLADAAKRGIKQAIEWLKSGIPPVDPQWVASVPIITPAGWA